MKPSAGTAGNAEDLRKIGIIAKILIGNDGQVLVATIQHSFGGMRQIKYQKKRNVGDRKKAGFLGAPTSPRPPFLKYMLN